LVILVLYAFTDLRANKAYPLVVAKRFEYPGGRLVANTYDRETYFFLKKSWIENSETILKWRGTNRSELIGIRLGLDKILDLEIVSRQIILIGQHSNKLLCQFYNFDMELQSSFLLDTIVEPISYFAKIKKYHHTYFFLANNKLWTIQQNNDQLIPNLFYGNIEDYDLINSNLYLIEKHDQFIVLKEYQELTKFSRQIRLESAEINKFRLIGDYIFVKSTFPEINSTLVQIISQKNFRVIYKNIFDLNSNLIDFKLENNAPAIFYSYVDQSKISIEKITILNQNPEKKSISLNQEIYEPIKIEIQENHIFLVARNSLIILNSNLKTNLLFKSQCGGKLGDSLKIQFQPNKLILSTENYSELLEIKENPYWFVYYIYFNLLKFIIPIILGLIAFIFFNLYNRQKKVFTELLNLPSANIFIILDAKGNVEYLSAKARELLMIDPAVKINVPLPELLKNQIYEPILSFYEQAIQNPSYHSQKLTIINNREAREYLFSISPYFSVSGTLNGFLINALDITEQLERKKMSNWAQLAHDMQTNLLTIKLNAEQMVCDENSDNNDRKNRILHQVNLLQKRVRDIVTIGRSTNLELVATDTIELMNEAASEFDRTMFPNVDISVICEKIDLVCDKPKILRAIRNCIENGIKALPDGVGRIDLNAWTEGKMVCLSVKDNGKGMDELTKKKFLEPYFSTSKDGSGFGIGTIIIQQAVELHNGKIEIKSKPGLGTEIIIKLPRIRKN